MSGRGLDEAFLGRAQQGRGEIRRAFPDRGLLRKRSTQEGPERTGIALVREILEEGQFMEQAGHFLGFVDQDEDGGRQQRGRVLPLLLDGGAGHQLGELGERGEIQFRDGLAELPGDQPGRGQVYFSLGNQGLDLVQGGSGEGKEMVERGVEVHSGVLEGQVGEVLLPSDRDRVQQDRSVEGLSRLAPAEDEGGVEEIGVPFQQQGLACEGLGPGRRKIEGGELVLGRAFAPFDEMARPHLGGFIPGEGE